MKEGGESGEKETDEKTMDQMAMVDKRKDRQFAHDWKAMTHRSQRNFRPMNSHRLQEDLQLTVKRYEITNDVIEKISNPSNWSGDSSRVNFNASSLSSDLGDWGDESIERHIAKHTSKLLSPKKKATMH